MSQLATVRYRPLGAFRFALALMVVLQHFQHLLPDGERGLFSRTGSGAIAVAAFFAVSGFVVAEALASFYVARPGAFLLNRLLRLGPPYLAALTLSVLVHAVLWQLGRLALWDFALVGSPLAPARLLTGLFGLVPGFEPRWLGQDFEFVPYVWSLRLEAAFYVAAAATMMAMRRAGASWLVPAIMALALVASALFLVLARRPTALSTVPMFIVGIALFLCDMRANRLRIGLLAISLCVAAAGFASWRQHGAPWLAIQMPVLGGLLMVFAWLLTCRVSGRRKRLDRALGDLSYPLYLNHYVVGISASSLPLRPDWWLLAGATLVSVGLAAALEQGVERPMRPVRDRIRKARTELLFEKEKNF